MWILTCLITRRFVEVLLSVGSRSKRRRRLLFENMWVTDPSCAEVVGTAWSSSFCSEVVENLLRRVERVERCAGELSKWNKKKFGMVGAEIRKLEQQFRGQRGAISQHETLRQIREWTKHEEILWWPQARFNYLKHEDTNGGLYESEYEKG